MFEGKEREGYTRLGFKHRVVLGRTSRLTSRVLYVYMYNGTNTVTRKRGRNGGAAVFTLNRGKWAEIFFELGGRPLPPWQTLLRE